ncbi:hypothetical protein [Hymenobacter cheonanensis]|uniref:hypothetical protein n=1 Tax=Hymenobacter sp. CA2-7 TaxID=3063993 RepID=UPI0027125161|nr:hypothetical protein [Hymenobacter sp. CA2-7]MDO7886028.1 hypothetical protein [Hymenobacter sp. CA2-7]
MRKLFFLVPALLLAGCRGEQVAFQFQPATATSGPVAAAPAATSPEITIVAAAAPPEATATPSTKLPAPPAQRLRPRRLAVALKALPQSTLLTLAAPAKASWQLTQHLRRRHATEGEAENGLGRVALFFIGVTLAVLAGLAALFALIPGVSFWGGLGLAVGALVVLFLLYSLVSGGKKKKA